MTRDTYELFACPRCDRYKATGFTCKGDGSHRHEPTEADAFYVRRLHGAFTWLRRFGFRWHRQLSESSPLEDQARRELDGSEYRPDLGCRVRQSPTFGEGYWLLVDVPEDLEDRVTDKEGHDVAVRRRPSRGFHRE